MSEMERSFAALSERLLAVDKALTHTKDEVLEQEKRVFASLESAARRFAPESGGNPQGNALREVINGIFEDFGNAISRWREEMHERSEVRQKLEQMGAGLIVVVFGRTNAGKSTLGNFFRGKQLREAPFDNAWKNETIQPGPIRVIERAHSEEEKQEEGEWLAEGATETTREAQLFQLPGFLWLDTPGFGSTNDKSYGSLARKYVKRADLVIYLENSDNPGCKDITDQFVTILKEGRYALIAINCSDRMEQCRGEDGKRLWTEKTDENGIVTLVRVMKRVAKTAENRKQQEDYLVRVIGEKLGGKKKVEAISISTLLACEAVQNNDDTQFADSNMGALFARILDLIADDDSFITLKSRDAVQNCIALIDRVIGEEDSGPAEDRGKAPQESQEKRISLKNWDKRLAELEGRVKAADEDFNIDMETKNITASIMLKARPRLQKLVEDEEARREAGHKNSGRPRSIVREVGKGGPIPDEKGPEIDINPLMEQFAQEAGTLMEEKAKKLLKDLWLQEAIAIRQAFPSIERVTLRRRTERHEYEAYTTESYERDPDGVIETVCSWLGKSYHGTRLRKFMKEQIIDLGYNTQEVSAQLADRMEEELDAYVRAGLEQIRAECLTRGLRMLGERRAVLGDTEKKLLSLRGELESRLDGNTQ